MPLPHRDHILEPGHIFVLLTGLRAVGGIGLAQRLVRFQLVHGALIFAARRVYSRRNHGIREPLTRLTEAVGRAQGCGTRRIVKGLLPVQLVHLVHENVFVLLEIRLVDPPLLHRNVRHGFLRRGLLDFVRTALTHSSPHMLI
ncbi:hypothetical protein D3C84_775840 [compost metagenome]